MATARGLAVAPFSAAFSTVTIPAGTSPLAVAVAPNGNVYVGNANSANVTEISPLTVTTSPTSPACAQPVTFNISGGTPNGTAVVNFGDASPTVTVPLDVTGSGQRTHAYTVGTFTATVNGNPTSVIVSPTPRRRRCR
ncbi:hypothetical protein [Streptomyces griseofuscus]|uniref:hypothetical protein n=1 Tax=Streptomyces griseofuscus TaxID=146922 RepID=UPI003810C44F